MSTALRHSWWQDLEAESFEWTIPEKFNIGEACTDLQPQDDPALIVDSGDSARVFSFGELGHLSRKFVALLDSYGLESEDRVAIMVPQGIEVLTAHLGGFRGGFITVPLSVKFAAEAVAYRLENSGAKVLVIDATNFDRLDMALVRASGVQRILVVGAELSSTFTPDESTEDFWKALDAIGPSNRPVTTAARAKAIIIYTSGTTGNPKGALHGHQVLLAHMTSVRTTFDNAPQAGDVFWTPADWAWIGGLFDVLFPALALGRPVVAFAGKFTADDALRLMKRHSITSAFIPPTALKQMRSAGVDARRAAGTVCRTLATGGEALGESLEKWVNDTFGCPVNEFYGQTEMNLTIGTSRAQRLTTPGSMGRPFLGFEAALLDFDGVEVPTGEVGEICIRTGNPGEFMGYWNDEEKTRSKVYDGWIHTGDLARKDGNGDYWYSGRTDDVISTAGYRVGPSEVESCLATHPAVSMAAVIGVPDELRGQAVQAFIVPNPGFIGSEALTKELQNHVKNKLAFYQYPRHISYLEELPMTTTGKIMRRSLRAMS